ncbi:TetR/AcrR family transcriptional regulator [Iamia sp. SCSIO 61187]|uniref:TetR/AcrR family transcriptional regulator n=1 Tax=Iamia sp. SCSIO 61187 TaxID=2722752 RepID=UPI001C62E8CA|nr:TetR/AcrR family transcriptional regulator [Iamia sp. SCSIO 61187]QYG92115.1 TetR/AcrR family transcriptional regulator [Iamia sp. SCSIO 61187]
MAGVKGQVQARGVERRRAIVAAATEHFAREGYRGTGIGAIAKAAGVTTGGVLHHFGSKEGLLIAVLQQRDRDAVAAFESAPTATVADELDRWVDVAAWNEGRAAVAALHTVLLAETIAEDHPARGYFIDRNRAVVEVLAGTLQRGVDRGELRPDLDVAAKAAELHALIEGAHLLWLHSGAPTGLAPTLRTALDDQLRLMTA